MHRCDCSAVGAPVQIAQVASQCLQYLANLLLAVCSNPSQPGFNHWLFESVAALIRYSAAKDIGRLAELEQHLFPAFQTVLQNDVQVLEAGTLQLADQLNG